MSDHQVSCSAPVFAMGRYAIATIHVVAPAFRIGDSALEHIIRLSTAAAERLSIGLGWQKP